MKIKTRELTLCAVLAALALALSYMESFFPLALIVPLPGVKLGLANIVTLYALYALGFPSALAILLVRCTLGALFAGNASALLFSLLGGLSALLVMALLSGAKKLSIFGVSIAGAAAHNCGQVCAALITLGSTAPLYYLPFLLLACSIVYAFIYVSGVEWMQLIGGDIVAAQCLMFTGILESCIQCGLIQTNTGY